MKFSTAIASSALASVAMAGVSNNTVVTTEVTVTGYTTYCPEATQLVVTKCHENACAPTTITVTAAQTVIVEEPCVVTSTYTKASATVAPAVTTSAAPTSAAPVSTWEGAAAKNVAGVAAFLGAALALV